MSQMETSISSASYPGDSLREDYELAVSILQIIYDYRTLVHPPEGTQRNNAAENPVNPSHLKPILKAVSEKLPIRMILPAFPGKSPNRQKTLGPLPDLGEIQALHNIAKLCHSIDKIYPAGSCLVICSDGYCFADVVHIPDDDIAEYTEQIKKIIASFSEADIKFFDLKDCYPEIKSMDVRREELMVCEGESLCELRIRCKREDQMSAMFRGITKFLFEDYSGLQRYKDCTKTQIQNQAKVNSYRVIQRSNAWSRLIERRFPDSVRLSIHPQYPSSPKIGIRLVDSADLWMTPWHSVAVKENGSVRLVRRAQIDETKHVLVYREGRPSHFQALAMA